MRLVSTAAASRGAHVGPLVSEPGSIVHTVSFRDALLTGLSPDGGLYLPAALPSFSADEVVGWRGGGIAVVAARVLGGLVGDEFEPETFEGLVRDAFDFPAPTVAVQEGIHVLELFHGPTLAFKDFGARFLGRVFGSLLSGQGGRATILVATSGDTGSAVAQGFHGVATLRVAVLYPAGRVSPFQEAQMATLGGNISAVRVPGSFDDCQRLVKAAFLDESLESLNLSSANSINIGRLLPQAVYYFAALLALSSAETPGAGLPDALFSVPSGNLGNLTAGVIAQRCGLPVTRFVAASNVNDVLPEYLATGRYRARSPLPTISNAMDVGDPSNFVRLAALHGGALQRLRENVAGFSVCEDETRATIRGVYRETGYILDPHSAVGYAAARRYRAETGEKRPIVTLATAHPAKFAQTIREELGFEPPLPEEYREWASRPLLAHTLPDTSYDTFRRWLQTIA
ncbi:MAG: threonine synthase [Acidobacteria bacterium]|nr:MAG: threonine synthase [Acidobacteriota bacterium]